MGSVGEGVVRPYCLLVVGVPMGDLMLLRLPTGGRHGDIGSAPGPLSGPDPDGIGGPPPGSRGVTASAMARVDSVLDVPNHVLACT